MGAKRKKPKGGYTRSAGMKVMGCFFCQNYVKADKHTQAVLCSNCTGRLTGSPAAIGKVPAQPKDPKAPKRKRGRPRKHAPAKRTVAVSKAKTAGWGRGWHLKKLFKAPDGKKYAFGKLVK